MNFQFDFPDEKEVIDKRQVRSVKEFKVNPVHRTQITAFIKKWHYSKSINGVRDTYCFGLFHEQTLIGAAIFGPPATPGVAECYSNNGNFSVIELRRLCCIDLTPKNTESYFIGKMLDWIKKNTIIDIVISYSDLTYGHEGIIYKASNFTFIGTSPSFKKIKYNGKLYHDKALRCYNGSRRQGALKKPFSIALGVALERGEACLVETMEKNIYLYKIKRKKKSPSLAINVGVQSQLSVNMEQPCPGMMGC